jgi:NADPH:quinone reductase-like Zn-dependent oxidoreductase
MKAFQAGVAYSTSFLSIVTKARPVLQPTEVLIDINAVSLNYRDKLVVNGIWEPPAGRGCFFLMRGSLR